MIITAKGVVRAEPSFAWNTRTRLHLRVSWMQNCARWNIDPFFTITAICLYYSPCTVCATFKTDILTFFERGICLWIYEYQPKYYIFYGDRLRLKQMNASFCNYVIELNFRFEV